MSKYETRKRLRTQTTAEAEFAPCFEFLDFGDSSLFRISEFDIRAWPDQSSA